MKNILRYSLGLMSGTSVDAIDASLVACSKNADDLILHHQKEFSPALRKRVLRVVHDQCSTLAALTKLNYDLGHAFADAAKETLVAARKKRLLPKNFELHCVGCHGQTIFHEPLGPRTFQIGESALVAAKLGVTVVNDFRVADTAVGGQGAPLLPWYHQFLFKRFASSGVSIHNLGGISNYTYLGPNNEIIACDTGPANCLLDSAIQLFTKSRKTYDQGGRLARKGNASEEALSWFMNHPQVQAFRRLRAPKSTGRELFSLSLLKQGLKLYPKLSQTDFLATLSHLTSETIIESYKKEIFGRKLPLKRVILAGGGSKNEFLKELLQQAFPKVAFTTMEDHGLSSQALESQAFARFALATLDRQPITFASTTGAKLPAICGKISFPPKLAYLPAPIGF